MSSYTEILSLRDKTGEETPREWPNTLPVKKYVKASGSPNAALQFVRDLAPQQMCPKPLQTVLARMPAEQSLTYDANANVAAMTTSYNNFLNFAGFADNAGLYNNFGMPVMKGSEMVKRGFYAGQGNLENYAIGGSAWNSMFGTPTNDQGSMPGAASLGYMKDDSANLDIANWWKACMARLATQAGVNPVYFIRFGFEKCIIYCLENKIATNGQMVFFAKRYLGFTPGTDWRDFPGYVTKV